jgi:type VII secretion protein EccB
MVVTMHNRRDQVQAHNFMVSRLVSALLKGEPDLATPPLRRTSTGLVIGIVLAVLGIGGLFAYGVISPGGASAWRKPGTLIVDKKTGSRYVLDGGRLLPVANYASARLLLGADLTVDALTTSSISGVARGPQIGIPGAPDALPDPDGLRKPWLSCATTADPGARPALSLRIGAVTDFRPLTDRQAILVRTVSGTSYLVLQQQRLRITEPWVPRALGLGDGSATVVPDAWINTLPAGPDLPQPPGQIGTKGPDLDGVATKTGAVYVVHATGVQSRFYRITAAGLEPATQTAAALILGNPATAKAYHGTVSAHELSPAALAVATVLPAPAWQGRVPAIPPTPGDVAGRMPCLLSLRPGTRDLPFAVTMASVPVQPGGAVQAGAAFPGGGAIGGGAIPGGGATGPAGAPGALDGRVADEVRIAPGAGLVARTLPAPGVPGAGLYLITEEGEKYPVASEPALKALGYTVAGAAAVPADLLALLPTGPVLDVLGARG